MALHTSPMFTRCDVAGNHQHTYYEHIFHGEGAAIPDCPAILRHTHRTGDLDRAHLSGSSAAASMPCSSDVLPGQREPVLPALSLPTQSCAALSGCCVTPVQPARLRRLRWLRPAFLGMQGAACNHPTDVCLACRMLMVMWGPRRRPPHAAQRHMRSRRSMQRRSRARSSGSPGCPRCPERAPSPRTPTARWGPACSAAPALRRLSRQREISGEMLQFQPVSLGMCSLRGAFEPLTAALSAQCRERAMRSRPLQ